MLAKSPITVLMTGVGAPGAFGILQCLRNNGERDIRIVGVDMNSHAGCSELVDSFYVVPAAADDSFVDVLYEIAVSESVDVVLPIVTRELMKLSQAKKRFLDNHTFVCVLDPEPLALVNNKANLLSFCRDEGLPVPNFRVASTADEVEEALEALGCDIRPVYVKSALGNGSRGVRFVDPARSKYAMFFNEKPDSACMSKADIMEALRERDSIPTMLVMEALPGVEYSADIIASKGRVLFGAVRKSAVVRSSITLESTVVDEPRIMSMCSEITKKLGLDGNIGFDFRADASGYPQLMEANPRLTATVVLNAVAGINFPYLGIKHVLGEGLPEVRLRYGISMHRRYEERYTDENGYPLMPFDAQ